MNPITVELLKEDWADAPYVSAAQREALERLSDDELNAALQSAFLPVADTYYSVLDCIQYDATRSLLRDLGL
ncbi:hypothetical protein ABT263_38520 [Kitasatospora sp. NPDC001603]|uniref:hypothetical protein n=1 Tax=Kitasatospora sp. NPDC001603 TaxID=3154388 RepID=UPI00332ABCD7